MVHLYRIAVNSFREALREPVYFLMLFGALLLIGHYPWMTLFVFREQLKLVLDGAMATTMFFSLAVSVLCATTTISREMRNGTVLLLLSKPITRLSFVLGKIAGIVAASVLFCFVCNCASVISIYIATDQFRMETGLYIAFVILVFLACVAGMVMNYLRGTSFSEYSVYAVLLLVVGMMLYCFKFQPHPEMSMVNLAKALVLLFPAVVVMSVLAVGFATRFDVVPSMCLCSLLFFLGLVSSYLFGGNYADPALDIIFSLFYAAIPNWQYFWMADAMAVNSTIPLSYVWWSLGYAAIYSIVVTVWAVVFFQNREAAGSAR
jgi:ABC-type transport system involved in multi-copper enzyme maturation permease subunit